MPARRRYAEIAAPEHQRGAIFIGFGGGVQPVTVGGALDVRGAYQRQAFLTRTIGTDARGIHVGRFIDETVIETDRLQRRDHFVIAHA
ncbi:hypothetical protein D3C86_1524440 [compost metagenome]